MSYSWHFGYGAQNYNNKCSSYKQKTNYVNLFALGDLTWSFGFSLNSCDKTSRLAYEFPLL